jgi:hypothetical protein
MTLALFALRLNWKKIALLTLGLAIAPAFAQVAEGLNADWMLMSEGKGLSQYANLKTFRVDGSKALIWEANVNKPENKSTKTYVEYDCQNRRFRMLSIMLYSDTTFSNLKESVNSASAPIHIPPDSYPADMLDILCKYVKR